MQSLFGFDLSTAQKVIIASVVILVLLALLGLFVRQIKGGRLRMKGAGGGRARQPRLGVVDSHDLDRQRQLILIRRDNVEHLIMIGGASDVVVETNIMRSGGRAQMQSPVDPGAVERPLAFEAMLAAEPPRNELADEPRRAPQPEPLPPLPPRPVQTAQPSPPRQPQAEAALVAAAAVAAAPAVAATFSPAPPPAAPPAPVITPPTPTPTPPAPTFAAPVPAPSVQPPSFARDHASPTASSVELDDMARQLEEALKRPFSAVRPAGAVAEPAAPPAPAPEPPKVVTPDRLADPLPAAPPLPTPTPPAPPVTTGRPVTLPADIGAELEMALGLRPERTSPKQDVPALVPAPLALPVPLPVPLAAPPPPPPKPAPILPASIALPDETASPPVAEPIEADLVTKDEPADKVSGDTSGHKAEPAEPEPAPNPASDDKPEPDTKPLQIDPFSVDAIEAEFARLLGRDPKPKG